MTDICAETVRVKRKRGFVYFITDGEAIKIGFSHWPTSRMADLQSAHPKPLSLIASFIGYMAEEKELHRHFSGIRIQGEWFRPDPSITALIEKLEAASQLIGVRQSISGVLHGKPPVELGRSYHRSRGESRGLERWIADYSSELTPEMLVISQRALLTLKMLDYNQPSTIEAIQKFSPITWAGITADLTAFTTARAALIND